MREFSSHCHRRGRPADAARLRVHTPALTPHSAAGKANISEPLLVSGAMQRTDVYIPLYTALRVRSKDLMPAHAVGNYKDARATRIEWRYRHAHYGLRSLYPGSASRVSD